MNSPIDKLVDTNKELGDRHRRRGVSTPARKGNQPIYGFLNRWEWSVGFSLRIQQTRQLSLLVDGPHVRLVALPIFHT